jgi:hypothetical protein
MKKLIYCLLFLLLIGCISLKAQRAKTAIIRMEKEQDGIVKSWISYEPTIIMIYKGEKVLRISNCKITFIKFKKSIELHFDYEYDRFDYYPLSGRQAFNILIYDYRENLIESAKHSVEVLCMGDGFAGKYKYTLQNIKSLKRINEIVIFPYSHEWIECDFLDEEYDLKIGLDSEK